MNQSIQITNTPQGVAQTAPQGVVLRGKFLEVIKSPALGQNFLRKHSHQDKKTPTPGEYFERSSELFLLIGIEILKFCRNQTLKRTGRLSNYSFVIPSSFSLSAILTVLKFSPSFETD